MARGEFRLLRARLGFFVEVGIVSDIMSYFRLEWILATLPVRCAGAAGGAGVR